MRISLFLLVLVACALSQSGDGEGGGDESPGGTVDKRAKPSFERIDWSGRIVQAGQERVYGWGLDKVAPALRISDKDRMIPARDRPTWKSCRKKFSKGRSYRNVTDEELHARIFEQTEKMVEEHNSAYDRGEVSYTLRINDFADFTQEEFARMENKAIKNRKVNLNDFNTTAESISHSRAKRATVPASFDWRTYNVFGPVKHQLYCGSCYAFACIGVFEAQIYRKTGRRADFSEQELLDCTYKKYYSQNSGCDGGLPTATFNYLNETGVLDTSIYPYTSGTSQKHGACKHKPGGTLAAKQGDFKVKSVVNVRPRSEDELRDILIEKGPVVITLAADNEHRRTWENIGNGVFDQCAPGLQPNHAVVLVGYGNEKGKDYWLMRNSWGTEFGMGGYMKIRRGNNQCNIMAFGIWYIDV